jgi:hypothetical protein
VIATPIIASTRILDEQPGQRERAQRTFQRGHKPERVATAIVGAIERDKAVVPVGWEAHLGWWANRLLPVGVGQLVARQGVI